jgi:hypothetical protein
MPIYTNDGKFVANILVPPWKIPPEMLVWGERFFIRRKNGDYTEALGSMHVLPRTAIEDMGTPYMSVSGEMVQPPRAPEEPV